MREGSLAGLATIQKGVVSHAQLSELGFSDPAIRRRIKAGRLREVHRGVYVVGHGALHPRAPWMAAVLAGGAHAVLSDTSCGALWSIAPNPETTVHITVTGDCGRDCDGITPHRRRLAPQDRTSRDGIPCTSVARTLLDIADTRPSLLVAACEASVRERLFDGAALAEVLDRCRGNRGAGRLRRAVSELTDDPDILRSELERRLKALLGGASLRKAPRFNQHVAGSSGTLWEVDVLWRVQRLVVEADSRAYHGTRSARERDAAKQRDLEAGGWEVWRVRWRDVHAGRTALLTALDDRLRT
ncbi:type IV toxin-antitoxin system AbiEi family antitoxin domain-containing protein [Conexibacter sp. SYSU D00693]|uniref:type IV toxin-antitoxin system AbiEi family antitoxin domain-containing protein n=1 Tax=Conexibacter sp. SYSU D00693 TaxID=2812560 RepID=UPI00196BA6F6|nr:type IV toxin-antitoxin system AbiEi family antitoxin domain-containing protein [Conexibacter sp. SYSU D00693]